MKDESSPQWRTAEEYAEDMALPEEPSIDLDGLMDGDLQALLFNREPPSLDTLLLAQIIRELKKAQPRIRFTSPLKTATERAAADIMEKMNREMETSA